LKIIINNYFDNVNSIEFIELINNDKVV